MQNELLDPIKSSHTITDSICVNPAQHTPKITIAFGKFPMTIDYPQIVGTPTRSKSRDCLHDVREDTTSNQAQNFLDKTFTCLHRHLEGDLGIVSGFLLAAGTPAFRGGLLGATLLGCHADKNFCKRVTQINEFLMRTKEESEFPSTIQQNLRAINLPNPMYFSN